MANTRLKKIKEEIGNKRAIEECAKKMKVACDESCLKICYLMTHYPKLKVTEIADILGVTQSAISHALARLKKSGFVIGKKRGRRVHYKMVKNIYTKALGKVLRF